MPVPFARSALLSLSLAALVACGGGADPVQVVVHVETFIAEKNYPAALEQADAALKEEAIAKDAAKAWRSESLRLDALASSGKGADVKASLERLAGTYAEQVTPARYRALADKLRAAKDGPGAIEVLDAGAKRFPEDASLKEAIESVKSSGTDPAEVEKLKALGYL